MSRYLVWLVWLAMWSAQAGPCIDPESVLLLARVADPVLEAERDEYRAVAEKPNWKLDLGAGWTHNGTEYGGAGGVNAGIRVSIPLVDRTNDIERARARVALTKSEDSRTQALLLELEKLCNKVQEAEALDEKRRLLRDKLGWQQKRVDEGYDKPAALWQATEEAAKADQDWRKLTAEMKRLRDRLARTFGGERWSEIKRLLEGS